MTLNSNQKRYCGNIYTILVFYLLYCFNTPVYAYRYKFFVVINVVLAIVAFFRLKRCNRKLLLFWCGSNILMLIAQLLNLDHNFSTMIGVSMISLFSLSIVTAVSKERFEKTFVYVMKIIAFASLIIYILAILFPKLTKVLPVFYGTGEYPHLLYVFFLPSLSHVYPSLLIRNEAMFCEMGIFAVLLIFTLIIILNNKDYKRDFWGVALLLLALFTTLSTTGFFSLLLLLPELYQKILKGKKFAIVLPPFLCTVIITFPTWSYIVFSKLSSSSSNYISFYTRLEGTKNDLSMWINHPWGAGITKFSKYTIGTANTITYLGCVFGTVFVFAVLYGICAYFCSSTNRVFSICRFICVVICLSTQGMSTYPLFYVFVYEGVKNCKIKMEPISCCTRLADNIN